MKQIASLNLIVVLAATCFATASPNASARNPLKPVPGDTSLPGDGGVGSTPSNAITLSHYQTVCQSRGKVSLDVRNMTVNGRKQAFLHTEAQQSDSAAENAALAYVQKNNTDFLDIKLQNPITFQLINGQTVYVTVTYNPPGKPAVTQNFVRPDSPYKGAPFLTSTGNNDFMIPIGAGSNAIPKGSTLFNLLFQTTCDQSCVTYTADLNNLRVNGVSVGIKTDSKSCGSGCSNAE